jgi:hypothetical protein
MIQNSTLVLSQSAMLFIEDLENDFKIYAKEEIFRVTGFGVRFLNPTLDYTSRPN